jgi:hypothetical protein
MARFFDVNPFDQPEVQSYKQELHKYIWNKKNLIRNH